MSFRGPADNGAPLDLGPPERVLQVVLGCRAQDVAEDVVLTPFVPLKAFRRHAAEPVLELAPPFFYKGFTAFRNGRRLTVISTGVGPQRVGDCVSLLSLTPARRLLFAGAVGGLSAECSVGDFFLPGAVGDGEGYTRYLRHRFEDIVAAAPLVVPSPGPVRLLEEFLRSQGVPFRTGRVFTVGCLTSESRENLLALVRLGYDALEMELSAFYSAAARHGFEACALTYVSDLPLRSPLWEPKPPPEEAALREAYRALPLLALEYLSGPSRSPAGAGVTLPATSADSSSGPAR